MYRHDAKELFVSYASRCPDKPWLMELVLQLSHRDDFGVRDVLIQCATEYLPESLIRSLIGRLQNQADSASDEFQRRHWLMLVASLARQVKDAALFEQTRIATWGSVSAAACTDIARVHLECGNAERARSWLARIPEQETFQRDERDRLLLEIHRRLGDRQQQAEVAWRIFRRHRCNDSLQELLSVIGEDQRDTMIAGEVRLILAREALSLPDAAFLAEIGRLSDTESYLLDRSDQLDGDMYWSLLPLAELLETDRRALAASVLYRALLDSILRRAKTNTYPHGVSYLKKLDRLAAAVDAWGRWESHGVYKARLRQQHGRKKSFWSKYAP